jgi:uncharacterized protein YlxP (DUF503 family)
MCLSPLMMILIWGFFMQIVLMTLEFTLPGCRSLKEKRQRMGGIHERYGRNPAVAVCESGAREQANASEWSFIVTGTSAQDVEALCSDITERIERTVEARVMNVLRQRL